MAGPAQTPRRSARATRGRRAGVTPAPPTEPSTPTRPTAPIPPKKITPKRLVAQRPAALAKESHAYGSPGRSTLSIKLAAEAANRPAADVIAAGVSTAKAFTTSGTPEPSLTSAIVKANPNLDSETEDSDSDQEATTAGSQAQSPMGSPVQSPLGSPVQSPPGSPVKSPAGSRPASGTRVKMPRPGMRITQVETTTVKTLGKGVGQSGSSSGSDVESDASTGNGTPMGEGYSWNFGTEGPIGRNVGLGGSPLSIRTPLPPLPVGKASSPGAGRGAASSGGNVSGPPTAGGNQATNITSRPAGGGGSRPTQSTSGPAEAGGSQSTRNTSSPGGGSPPIARPASVGGSPHTGAIPSPATLSGQLPADWGLRAALPNMTEEQLKQATRIRSERLARERRRQERQRSSLWTASFWATIVKVLAGITLLWVAYHALWAAPAGFRWASKQYHSQTAWLKQHGTVFEPNNTSRPNSTRRGDSTLPGGSILKGVPILKGITTNQYRDIDDRLTTFQNLYNSISVQAPQLIGPARVNYFSRGLGASIDPHLTSPTRKLAIRKTSWLGLSSYELRSPDPITALLPWSDVGDCWCAPPSGGKAQLTVKLPRKIVPTDLVIEHIPKGATLDIGAAPKDVELWVQIDDPEARLRVIHAAMAVPHLSEETLLAARTLPVYGADTALDKSWVRIGRWQYDIHADNYMQSFAVPLELDHFQLAVDRVSVRVRNNWGEHDYTCLYRLKLYGLLAEKESERRQAQSAHAMISRVVPEEVTLERESEGPVRTSTSTTVEKDGWNTTA
ncbi:hypothetical protein MMC15_004283 [Xylographa vitiligo]|nr:hypothetical protein [Xylographa vitiligo]